MDLAVSDFLRNGLGSLANWWRLSTVANGGGRRARKIVLPENTPTMWPGSSHRASTCRTSPKRVTFFTTTPERDRPYSGRYITDALLDRMITDRTHVCAEMMSKNDQAHGARVLKEMPVVTSIGVGTTINLVNKEIITANPAGFVDFKGFSSTVAFCHEVGLPVGSATIVTGSAANTLMARLSDSRDDMSDDLFNSIVSDEMKAYPDKLMIVEGSVTHKEVLGNCLEGLVIHA